MAQKCMDMFETHNLPALATLEQVSIPSSTFVRYRNDIDPL